MKKKLSAEEKKIYQTLLDKYKDSPSDQARIEFMVSEGMKPSDLAKLEEMV